MRKISFSWKPTISGREHWRWGLFMIVESRTGRTPRLRIMVRGVLLWILGLSSAGYLALTTTWFFMLEKRPVNYVTWIDCVLAPARWDQIKIKRGEAFVDEGLVALQDRRWSEAVLKIQAGLALAPHHWKGRRNLGMFFLAAGQRQRSLATLIDGFDDLYPGRDAVEIVMQVALAGEDYASVLALLDKIWEMSGSAVDRDREWLADQKSRMFVLSQRYEENLAWIAEREVMTDVRHESKVVSLIELKRFDDSRQALVDWGQDSGVLGGVRRLTVRLEREVGDVQAMRAALAEMRERSPLNAEPWIYSIIQESLAEEPDAASAALQAFLMRFGLKRDAVILAAKPLKQIEAWALFDQLITFAADSGFDDITLMQLRVEAALERGRYDQARRELDTYRASRKSTPAAQELAWYEITSAWIDEMDAGQSAAGEQLAVTLQGTPFDLAFGRKMAKFLEQSGRPESALRIWQVVRQRFPANPQALNEVARLSDQLGERVRPDIVLPEIQDGQDLDIEGVLNAADDELPSDIAVAIQSARLFFGRTDDLIAEQRWSEVDRLLRELRRARPLWVSAHQSRIREVEIELNLNDGNWPALISNLRLQLDGSIDRALESIKIARRLDALGQRRVADSVLLEIERRHQDFPPARRLRADWAAEDAASQTPPDEMPDSIPVVE